MSWRSDHLRHDVYDARTVWRLQSDAGRLRDGVRAAELRHHQLCGDLQRRRVQWNHASLQPGDAHLPGLQRIVPVAPDGVHGVHIVVPELRRGCLHGRDLH